MRVVRAMAEQVAGRRSEPEASLAHPVSPDARRLDAATGIFQMLADPTRLHLLWLLTHGEADVTALVEACGASRTAVSQHLAKLRFTGLVDTRREGRRVIYRLRGGHVTRLVEEALNHADHIVTGEPPHH
ncbi:MAG TPA: metalloregulator ArsR/SmtB family transcription factor [Nocardia sp.]|uniref:ArsR/SmtB family transcription factor n=1 Tax=Nocardia TaxID=1817 RepID=UPI002453BBD2|nr:MULTISPECIES: metalloregulator ArsR/SmtB family transcription factor [Nocardia]HLS76484.1 metalloregulator ArsR/SmtB family transcription factor [Nocardia sp.]